MSYARFSEGNIYLYLFDDNFWECNSCWLSEDRQSQHFHNLADVKSHVEAHQQAGHIVPRRCIEQIEEELLIMGPGGTL